MDRLTLTAVTYQQVIDMGACYMARTHFGAIYQPTDTGSALDCINDTTLDDRTAISWSLWLLAHTDRRTLVSLACDIAERAIDLYYKRDDTRPRAATALVRRWLAGESVTRAELRTAAAAADAAAAERKWQSNKIRDIMGQNPFK